MKRIFAGIAISAATLLSLTACGAATPTPAVTVTTTVTATPPAVAPLAELHYTTGAATRTVSFVVPASGYILETTCTDTAGENHVQYTESTGTGFGGTDSFACDPTGAKDVHVESPSDAKGFDLVGKKLTIDLGTAASLSGITKVDVIVKSLAF